MYHSIQIGSVNTWDDFGLISHKKHAVSPPKPKYNYVNAFGIDGGIDMSTAITGRLTYENRSGTWEFMTANRGKSWMARRHELMNAIKGDYQRVILEDEPNFYYRGRVTVKDWKNTSRHFSTITLDYYLEPYKYELNSANEPWIWDPFSFETGIIRNYGSATIPLAVSTSLELDVEATARPQPIIIHVLTATNLAVEIARSGNAIPLTVGEHDLTDVSGYVFEDTVHIEFTGTGTVWIEFQGGWL